MAPVVQRVDSAVHWITQLILLMLGCWILADIDYPLDSAIQRLNNRGQSCFCQNQSPCRLKVY